MTEKDLELERELLECVSVERGATGEVLRYLREVEKRQMYLARASSLFAYCTEHLGLDESAAQLRIQAVRLMKVAPEVERWVQSGEISLSVAALVQSAARREKLAPEQVRDLARECKGASKKEAEGKLAARFPRPPRRERAQPINAEQVEIRFTLSREDFERMQELLDRRAHSNFERSYEVLFTGLVEEALKKYEGKQEEDAAPHGLDEEVKVEAETEKPKPETPQKRSRHIPVRTQRAVWRRDKASCQHLDPTTGKICGETHGVQLDHIVLYSEGGSHELENLRLLCGAHNRYRNKSRAS